MRKKILKSTVLLPLITLFCFAGFIGSLLIPNTVLDTYVINMSEEEGDAEVLLPLSFDAPIVYEMDSKDRSMRGIQVGVARNGAQYSEAVMSYKVFCDGSIVSDNLCDLTLLDDGQYVYLPYENHLACKGKLRIEFCLQAFEGSGMPALIANHKEIKDTKTTAENVIELMQPEDDPVGEDSSEETRAEELQSKEEQSQEHSAEISLKGNHIYTHETYPFLFDFRILAFLFLAVSMTVSYPSLKKEKKKTEKAAAGGGQS